MAYILHTQVANVSCETSTKESTMDSKDSVVNFISSVIAWAIIIGVVVGCFSSFGFFGGFIVLCFVGFIADKILPR